MKKSVILTIVVVYILAIVAVGFLGGKMIAYETIYVSEIRIINSKDGAYTLRNTDKDPNVDFVLVDYKEGLKFQLYYEVTPENAADKRVEFHFDYGQHEGKIEVTKDGVVSVYANERITINGTVTAIDGSRIERNIRIQVKAK